MRHSARRLMRAAMLLLGLIAAWTAVRAADEPVLYTHAVDRNAVTIQDRDPSYAPTYLVYADAERTSDEAKRLVDALGIAPHLDAYKARLFVVGPVNGTTYDATADFAAFQNFLRDHRSSNLKIIAVGAGATFVNDVIAPHAFAVAGILTYGGSIDPAAVSTMPVPAYVHAASPAVGALYVRANGATKKTRDDGAAAEYANPDPLKSLQRVVLSKRGDAQESLAQAFQNAWRTVFSRNYRLYMRLAESYSQGFDPNNYTEPWELEPYVMYDELHMRYEAVTEDLPGLGLSLRYEYVPEKALHAAPKSVPLVVMLHGNMNDPRIQGESSGWPEVAAKNTIILTSVEWQGRTVNGTVFAPIGEAGTMVVLDRLLAKYPQIDPSRVYFTGLSAGAMNSLAWGLDHSDRIAAVAAHSAPFGPPTLMDAARKTKTAGRVLPMYSIAGTHDMYKPLPVNSTPRSFYSVIRAYALADDFDVPEAPDLAANALFGVKLDGERWGDLAGTRAMLGTFSNRQGVMVKLVALDPYGHWNYKPAAADMWAFLSQYRRDPATGRLDMRPAR